VPISIYTAESGISGTGAFAGSTLKARRKIGELDGERITIRTARAGTRNRRKLYLVELGDGAAIDGSRGRSPLWYVNHSCSPNTFLRVAHGRVEFYALRTIREGSELTVDYGPTHHDGRLRCRCGAANCVGFL
jgi:SET domain-containing protein